MSRALRITAFACAVAVTLAGCAVHEPMGERTPATGTPQIIDTQPAAPAEGRFAVNMYYQYGDQPYLASEIRLCDLDDITTVTRAWLEGPQENTSLTRLTHPDTHLISATLVDRQAVVVFSSAYYDPLPETPATWERNSAWRDRENLRRRLCLYALVNTLTESGLCSSVELQVVNRATGTAERPLRSDAGFPGQDGEIPHVLERDTALILTPHTALKLALDAAARGDAAALYPYLAYRDSRGEKRPAEDDVAALLRTGDTLSSVQIGADSVIIWEDGSTATVSIHATLATKNDAPIEYTVEPIRMIKENGIWKIELRTLLDLLNAS